MIIIEQNKKLRCRGEHSSSVMLSWCTFMTFIGRQTTDQQLIDHLYETVRSLENACHTRAPCRCVHDEALYKYTFIFTLPYLTLL